ncbi:Protein of unknown function DUF247, plant [Dillenia turbinata]|uniref:Uncharacterized protein n=1 Tax=Dillenia turbinata TaxID=194707 RepID=A0AAN8Z9R4_9MAGN
MLIESGPPPSPGCCIYKVPRDIRLLNVAAYEPCVVSIGPFHHGKSNLKTMEERKIHYFRSFVQRANLDVDDLVNTVKEWEEETRASYGEKIEFSRDDFVLMILFDGIFIIELFLRKQFPQWREDYDNKLTFQSGFFENINSDLILLENQLPFFVLKRIFNYAFQRHPVNFLPLIDLTFLFFSSYNTRDMRPEPGFEREHFLDFVRTFRLPSNSMTQHGSGAKVEFRPGAKELHKAGVEFKKASSERPFHIHFENSILELPCLNLYDDTESYFRNLMVFEQCHYPNDSHIRDYVAFMDFLINTTEDVDLLVQSGVIENNLGDAAAVATLFNSLCKNITIDDSRFSYASLCEELNAHCKFLWHHWKAILRRDYFSNPWRTAATIAAIMLLVLTLVQTICSIISLRK